MTLIVFLAALIGGMLIGIPICFALLFSGVCMMLYLTAVVTADLILRFYHRIYFPVQIPFP